MNKAHIVMAFYTSDDDDSIGEPVRVFLDKNDADCFCGLCNGVTMAMAIIHQEIYELRFLQTYVWNTKEHLHYAENAQKTILELQAMLEVLNQDGHPAFLHPTADYYEVLDVELEM